MYEYNALITNIVDGDTVDARIELGFHMRADLRLRLARVNAPEKGDEPGYSNAKNFVKAAVESAPVVIRTSKSDNWDRWIAEIEYQEADKKTYNLSDQLLQQGLAKPYTK